MFDNLPKDVRDALATLLTSSISKKKAKVLLDNMDVSDEVRQAFLKLIDEQAGETNMTLKEALKVPGMQDYIDLVREEATKELEDQKKELETKLADAESKIAELNEKIESLNDAEEKVKEAESAVKDAYINQIVSLSVALRKSEINMQAVEDSVKKLKEDLQDKALDELKDQASKLQEEFVETFHKTPTETVDKDTNTKDNHSDDDDKDVQDGDVEIKTLSDVFSVLLKTDDSKTNE